MGRGDLTKECNLIRVMKNKSVSGIYPKVGGWGQVKKMEIRLLGERIGCH